MRKILAGLAIFAALAGFTHAFAQAPGPVPALPDAERRTSAVLTASTGPVNVGFAIYGDGTDYGNWLEVLCNNVIMTPVTQWTMTSPSGSIGNLARPITNAQISFVTPQTCTVQIVGARRPRRTSQFAENRGVAARDLNQVLTDIIAMNRETWDKINDFTGRAIVGLAGEDIPPMPPANLRAGQVLGFDATGLVPTMYAPGGGGGGGGSNPGLPVGSVQTNGGGSTFAGSANFTFTGSTATLGVAGSVTGSLAMAASAGGAAILQGAGSGTLTLPAATDTLVGKATTDTFTNKTYDTAGSGNVLRLNGQQIVMASGNTNKLLSVSGVLTNAHCLTVDANGNATDSGASCGGGGGGATPGNPTTSVQFNSAGAFAGSANLTFISPTLTVGAAGVTGKYAIAGLTSGTTTLQALATASGALTLPNATDTLVGKATTDALTNKSINGMTVTPSTGTFTLANGKTFTANNTLTTAGVDGKTLTINNSLTLAGTDATTWTGPTTNATLAALNIADQVLTGGASVTTKINAPGNIALDVGAAPIQSIINNGAFSITAGATDGSADLQVINAVGAAGVTLVNYSGKTPKGDTFSAAQTSTATVTFTAATPTSVAWIAHGLVTSAMVYFTSSGTMPSGITSGQIYYVCSAGNTTNAFQIASTRANALAGTCLPAATAGTPTITGVQPSVFLLTTITANGLATGLWTQQQ